MGLVFCMRVIVREGGGARRDRVVADILNSYQYTGNAQDTGRRDLQLSALDKRANWRRSSSIGSVRAKTLQQASHGHVNNILSANNNDSHLSYSRYRYTPSPPASYLFYGHIPIHLLLSSSFALFLHLLKDLQGARGVRLIGAI